MLLLLNSLCRNSFWCLLKERGAQRLYGFIFGSAIKLHFHEFLLQIASSLEDVAGRLKKIEGSVRGERSVSFGGSSLRKQSLSRSMRSRVQSSAGLSPNMSLVPPPDGNLNQYLTEDRMTINDEVSQQSDSDSSDDGVAMKIQRDDTVILQLYKVAKI